MKNLPPLQSEGNSGILDSAEVRFQPAFQGTLSTWAVLTGLPDGQSYLVLAGGRGRWDMGEGARTG